MSKLSRKDFLNVAAGSVAALAAFGPDFTALKASAQGGNNLINVASLAIGGSGTEASPWMGWEASLNAAPEHSAVYFPGGVYGQSATISLKKGWAIKGDGRTQSIILSSVVGDAFQSNSPLNSSTGVYLVISDIGLRGTNSNNTGAGITDVGGTYINIHRVEIRGFKYGIILDQSELTDIDLCHFESQLLAGVWLANGPDHTPGAQGGFTNRISIRRCQFNNRSDVQRVAIIDDGGVVHSLIDNNYNGFTRHLYLAGINNGVVASSEFESAAGTPIISTHVTYHTSTGVGQNTNLTIRDNLIAPTPGNSAISFSNGSPVVLLNNRVNSTVPAFAGTANCYMLVAIGNFNESSGGLFDGTAPRRLLFNLAEVNLETTRLAIGGGVPITKHLSATSTWSLSNLANNGVASTVIAATGAIVGDTVSVGFSQPVPAGAILVGAVTAPNVVTATLFNQTGSALTLGAGTLRADVWQH